MEFLMVEVRLGYFYKKSNKNKNATILSKPCISKEQIQYSIHYPTKLKTKIARYLLFQSISFQYCL